MEELILIQSKTSMPNGGIQSAHNGFDGGTISDSVLNDERRTRANGGKPVSMAQLKT